MISLSQIARLSPLRSGATLSDPSSCSISVRINVSPKDVGYYPVGFVDFDENELEGAWIPMGFLSSSGRTLIDGTTILTSKTFSELNTLVKSLSPRATFFCDPILNFIRDLEYLLYKTTNIKNAAGRGLAGVSSGFTTNTLINNGNVPGFKGTADKTPNKYFHSQVLGSYRYFLSAPCYSTDSSNTMYACTNYKISPIDRKNYTKIISLNKSESKTYWPSHLVQVHQQRLPQLLQRPGIPPDHDRRRDSGHLWV